MRPIILDYSLEKLELSSIEYIYSHKLNLNIIKSDGVDVPYINLGLGNLESTTKTYTDREKDDDWNYLLEVATKTRIDRESDDQ